MVFWGLLPLLSSCLGLGRWEEKGGKRMSGSVSSRGKEEREEGGAEASQSVMCMGESTLPIS